MKRLLGKLTYANVVSTLCLFLVLGGGAAFAASKLGKNTVGVQQLKPNAVTAAKIKAGAVTGAKLKLSTLGAVPQAQQAVTATSAATAATANNANLLGGVPSPGYQRRSMWALVNGDGTILSQSGGISLQAHGPGGYWLHFPEVVAGKAISATAWNGWEPEDPGIEAAPCGGVSGGLVPCAKGTNTTSDAFVGTQEEGAPADVGFYIVVIP